jgi:hypothetical protein
MLRDFADNNKNFAERGWKGTKTHFKDDMNANGIPPNVWLLLLADICDDKFMTTVLPTLLYSGKAISVCHQLDKT